MFPTLLACPAPRCAPLAGWEKIRLLTKRECDTHLYHLASWYLARCLQWLLIIPVLGLVFSVCYPMIQLQARSRPCRLAG